jgi:hypothetical protein
MAHGDPRRGFPAFGSPLALTGLHPPSHPGGCLLGLPLPVWPFALYVAFPRADYYGHADCRYGHRRISGRFPVLYVLALLSIPYQLSQVPIDGLHEITQVVVISQPIPATAGSQVDTGYVRFTCIVLCAASGDSAASACVMNAPYISHHLLSHQEWVGTRRGTLRPVSSSPPLSPCVRLSLHTAAP